MPSEVDISNRFTFHPARGDQAETYAMIREWAKDLALDLNEVCPESRELSLAITHLEEVVFWANASIARSGEASE